MMRRKDVSVNEPSPARVRAKQQVYRISSRKPHAGGFLSKESGASFQNKRQLTGVNGICCCRIDRKYLKNIRFAIRNGTGRKHEQHVVVETGLVDARAAIT